jgi:hypothetical protein
VSTLTENDYPHAISFLPILDKIFLKLKAFDADLALEVMTMEFRRFMENCEDSDFLNFLFSGLGDDLEFSNILEEMDDFVETCRRIKKIH